MMVIDDFPSPIIKKEKPKWHQPISSYRREAVACSEYRSIKVEKRPQPEKFTLPWFLPTTTPPVFQAICDLILTFPVKRIKLEAMTKEQTDLPHCETRISILNKNKEIFECDMSGVYGSCGMQEFGPKSALIKNFSINEGDQIRIKFLPGGRRTHFQYFSATFFEE
eukprot:Platyproteum_vivax@DN4363_c0_g1_i1.p1